MNVWLNSVGCANPEFSIEQDKADEILTLYYRDILRKRSIDVMHKVLSHPSIEKRHICVDNTDQLIGLKDEDRDKRMERFTKWSVKLASEAAQEALEKSDTKISEVTSLTVNTCTGYICPGISTYLIQEMGFNKNIRANDLVGSGCGGALPNIQLSRENVLSNKGAALSISVEICSATFEMDNDISLIISNAVFGDGAAAAVISGEPRGAEILDSESFFDPKYREDVRYKYKNGSLHNQITPRLPDVTSKLVPPVINNVLKRNSLKIADIDHWAIHPGGAKIIDNLKQELNLTEEKLEITREILREYGNMSSPTVLFEFKRIIENRMKPGELCCITAFGAGLSIHVMLLRGKK